MKVIFWGTPDFSVSCLENLHKKHDVIAIVTQTDNVPSKSNPKTSMLAYFSAIATLKGITESVRIGT